MASETELSWASGIFDGEGHVGIHQHKIQKSYGTYIAWRIQVTVANTHLPTVLRFQEIVCPGQGYLDVQHPGEPGSPKRRQTLYTIRLYAEQAAAALDVLLPWTFTKREQIKVGIAFRKTFERKRSTGRNTPLPKDVVEKRAALAQECRALKLCS